MAGVNKVILIGNLGKDPEVRYLENGSVVANLTLATTESYKDKNGNRIENTEWHDLEMWDGLAKIAEQFLNKGKTIYVEGRIKSDTWQDDQGNNRKRTRIRVQNMTMLGSPGAPQGSQSGMSAPQPAQAPAPANSAPQNNQPANNTLEQPAQDVADDLPF
ncbi:MAG: single-stranded DNA-binding protein [Cyclobacteriaceae bacterium]